MGNKHKTIAYLRVSTQAQDLEKDRVKVAEFVKARGIGPVQFYSEKISGAKPWRERKIGLVLSRLGKGDNLVLPELSRAGRSAYELSEIFKTAEEKGILVYLMREGLVINGDLLGRMMVQILSAVAEMERVYRAERTKAALDKAKKNGVRLGRPEGSSLDRHHHKIVEKLTSGVTQKQVAADFGVSRAALNKWLKKNRV